MYLCTYVYYNTSIFYVICTVPYRSTGKITKTRTCKKKSLPYRTYILCTMGIFMYFIYYDTSSLESTVRYGTVR